MDFPTPVELERGCKAFRKRAPRDAMYKIATFLTRHFWRRPADMADSLGVLLLTWNNAFYRYGSFDFAKLEKCIAKNLPRLEKYRARNILDCTAHDDKHVKALFNDLLSALAIAEGKRAGQKSPVAAVKALHLLAPDFFPLWDMEIARAYGCKYDANPAEQYLCFLKITQAACLRLQAVRLQPGKSLLKALDEYNYAKFTKGWMAPILLRDRRPRKSEADQRTQPQRISAK